MLQQLLENAGEYIHTSPWLAFAAVFLGGVMTASSPCVLAMIPLMISFVAGSHEGRLGPARGFGYSLIFVAGLSLSFVLLGMTAALAGKLYGDVSRVWTWIVVAVCLIMGLHMLGVLRFTIPMPANIQPRNRGALGAFILGLLFGIVSAPCAAPILVVLLTYVAGANASLLYGGFMLLLYALGHSVLILVAGTSMGLARKLLESRRMTRGSEILRRCAGAVIVLVGVYFAFHGLR
ncbi:MAG: cytochrome c biogenesis protein CcdA [bacterium]